MLKKVQACARALKKTGQKSKKRLVAKASRLNSEDLYRIASLKKFGIFDNVSESLCDTGAGCAPVVKVAKLTPSQTVRDAISKHLGDLFFAEDAAAHKGLSNGAGGSAASHIDNLASQHNTGEVLFLPAGARLPAATPRSQAPSTPEPGDDMQDQEMGVDDPLPAT